MRKLNLSRRSFLRASGVAIGLPFLEALQDRTAAAESSVRHRMVAVNVGLGLHAPNLIPTSAGRDYELTPYLQVLGDLRESFTVISGASHPEVGGGHLSGKSYLTAAKHPNSAGFKNTISIDQYAAEQLGAETRFGSLSLTSSGPGLSWSRAGVEVPAETRPSRVFQQLFLAGKPQEQAAQIQRLQDGQSVLDLVMQQAKQMGSRLAGRDRQKLEQYFEAVREAERRLTKAEAWEARPKPHIDVKPPQDETDSTKIVECMKLMYDMMHLAIQTDSTRFITYYFTGMNQVPAISGVDITEQRANVVRTLFWRGKRDDVTWSAVRDGELKLVRHRKGDSTEQWLFDLSKDIGEASDLAATQPLDRARLRKLLADWERNVDADR